jgi:hypothetical protein
MKPSIAIAFFMVDGRRCLRTPAQLKKTYEAQSMDEVFLKLARKPRVN